jgi:hypothetical protein
MSAAIRILFAFVIAATAGCSTVVVDRVAGAATTGKTYAEPLKKVNELAVERSLDFGAAFLAGNSERTTDLLNQTTDLHKARVRTVAESSAYLDSLAGYFTGLEALAKDDASDVTASALGGVADALTKDPFGDKLSDERKKALTGLAGLVAKQAHSAAVERALRRDADVVAQAIDLRDEMLRTVSGRISTQEGLEAKLAFQVNVAKPFTGNA